MDLVLKDICKSFTNSGKKSKVLDSINLTIKNGEFVTLLGPSGCGKTTLLTIIAGFKKADSGEIHLGEKKVEGPGSERGFVFQDYALFPWLTVKENIAYPLRFKSLSEEEKNLKIDKLLDMSQLKGKENFFPREISGGMQQRTAFVRSLAGEPEVLLMDEPLGALDFHMRQDIQLELESLWLKTKKTVVMVTHDIDEAISLSDRVVVMSRNGGEILEDLKIDLPRSRDKHSKEYVENREKLSILLEKALRG